MKFGRAAWSRHPDAINMTVVLFSVILIWAPRFQGPIDLRWDASVYYLLGTSLAEGRGYRLLSEPAEILAIQYPPLLPTIVAAHQLVLGTADPRAVGHALRLTYFAFSLGYVAAVYLLARKYFGPAVALPLTLAVSVCHRTIFFSESLFSELPFGLTGVAFFLCHRRGPGRLNATATAALGIASYLLKTAGIALLGAWVLEAALRREWGRFAGRAVVSLVPVLAWQGYVGRVESGGEFAHPAYAYQRAPYQYYNVSYAANLMMVDSFVPELGHATPSALARRFAFNLIRIPSHLGEACIGGANSGVWLTVQATRAIGLLVVLGMFGQAFRREWLLPTFVCSSIALVCATPWPGQFFRYFTPLMPFLLLALGEGLVVALGLVARRREGRWASAGAGIVVAAFWLIAAKNGYATLRTTEVWRADRAALGGRLADGVEHLLYFDAAWADFDAATAWIRAHSRPGDIVASSTPQWVFLRADRKAVMPPMEADPSRIQALLEAVPVRYLIVDNLTHASDVRRFLVGPVETFADRWELVHVAGEGLARIYRRMPLANPGSR